MLITTDPSLCASVYIQSQAGQHESTIKVTAVTSSATRYDAAAQVVIPENTWLPPHFIA